MAKPIHETLRHLMGGTFLDEVGEKLAELVAAKKRDEEMNIEVVKEDAVAPSVLNDGLGKDLSKMRDASYLLPPPGGEVVRELIGEIERLQRAAEPVAWRHETTCEFISDEMKREFPDTLFIRKCNIPLFGDPVIGTTEAISRPSDVILRKQIDAQNVALQEAREEYVLLKDQFNSANEKLLSRNGRIKELCEIVMDEYQDSDDRFQIAASTYSALGYFRDA